MKNTLSIIQSLSPHYKQLLLMLCYLSASSFSLASEATSTPDSPSTLEHKAPENDEFHLTLGGGTFYGPKYEGRDKEDLKFFPFIGIEYGKFSMGIEGIQYQVYEANDHSVSLGIKSDEERELSDLSKQKKGVGKVEGGLAISVSGEFPLFDMLTLGVEASKSTSHHQRFSASTSLGTLFPIYNTTVLGRFGISSTWNDAELNQLFYGVNTTQSIKSGLPTFKAHSGFKDLSYSFTSIFSISRPLNLTFSVIYKQLKGDAARSPIIERTESFSVVQTLSYRF